MKITNWMGRMSASVSSVAVVSFLLVSNVADAQAVVVPAANLDAEGGGGSSVLNDNIRLQEIYNAALMPDGPVTITEMRFRPSAHYGAAFTATISNINIRLSTTTVMPVAISSTFAANVGTNETVVFDGELTLASAFTGPASGPKDFDIVIPFATPFSYDPSQGNLLVDIRNFRPVVCIYAFAASSGDIDRTCGSAETQYIGLRRTYCQTRCWLGNRC